MAAEYIYQFTDTANDAVNPESLDQEIQDAGPWSEQFDGVVVRTVDFKVLFDNPITPAEKVNLDAIVAAHQGVVTERFSDIIRSLGGTTNATFNWERKIVLPQTPPLSRGWYRVEVFCMHSLDTAPVDPATDRSEVRLMLDDGDGSGESQRAMDVWGSDRNHTCVLINDTLVQHGETISGGLDFRRGGPNMVAKISRAVLTVQPLNV